MLFAVTIRRFHVTSRFFSFVKYKITLIASWIQDFLGCALDLRRFAKECLARIVLAHILERISKAARWSEDRGKARGLEVLHRLSQKHPARVKSPDIPTYPQIEKPALESAGFRSGVCVVL
jgi:hypothetical protein